MQSLINVVPYFIMQNVSNRLVSFPLLASLDNFITSVIKHPDCEGKNFMDALEIYNCGIVNLIQLVVERNEVIAKVATDLRVQGGPIFLKQKINRAQFKKRFQWTNRDIEHLFDLRSVISKHWKRFYKLYRKNKDWFTECLSNSDFRTENPNLELSRLDFNFTSDEEFDFSKFFPYL